YKIPVLKENIDKFFPAYKADSAWVVLHNPVNRYIGSGQNKPTINGKVIEYDNLYSNIGDNYNFLKDQTEEKNIRYIRLLFKNSEGKVYKFIELNADKTTEYEAVSLNDGYWEINWKFRSGKIKRKLIYPETIMSK